MPAERAESCTRITSPAIRTGLSGVSLAAFYGSYAFMASRAAAAALSLGDLTLYLAVFQRGQESFSAVLYSVSGLYEDGLYMSNLFTYLDIATAG